MPHPKVVQVGEKSRLDSRPRRGVCCRLVGRAGNGCFHLRPPRVRNDLQPASKLLQAFAHSRDADAKALGSLLLLSQDTIRDSASFIFDLQVDNVVMLSNSNPHNLAAGVALDVGQTFLHHPKKSNFVVLG